MISSVCLISLYIVGWKDLDLKASYRQLVLTLLSFDCCYLLTSTLSLGKKLQQIFHTELFWLHYRTGAVWRRWEVCGAVSLPSEVDDTNGIHTDNHRPHVGAFSCNYKERPESGGRHQSVWIIFRCWHTRGLACKSSLPAILSIVIFGMCFNFPRFFELSCHCNPQRNISGTQTNTSLIIYTNSIQI